MVDDHAIVREGIKSLLELEDDVEIVDEANSSNDCLQKINHNSDYDVILMDLKMPGVDGIAATRLIKEKFSTIKVLILTNYDDEDFVMESINAGADGYVLKDVKKGDLIKIIRGVLQDRSFIDPGVTHKVFDRLKRTSIFSSGGMSEGTRLRPVLSERELQILELLVEGISNKDIADTIYVSVDTVKAHLKNIYKKLGVHCRAQAAKTAIQEEIIHLSSRTH